MFGTTLIPLATLWQWQWRNSVWI